MTKSRIVKLNDNPIAQEQTHPNKLKNEPIFIQSAFTNIYPNPKQIIPKMPTANKILAIVKSIYSPQILLRIVPRIKITNPASQGLVAFVMDEEIRTSIEQRIAAPRSIHK